MAKGRGQTRGEVKEREGSKKGSVDPREQLGS